jgi:hypothetical protein
VAEGPEFAARQLTAYNTDDGQELGDLSLSDDGNIVLYTRGGEKNPAGQYPNPTSNPAGVEQSSVVLPGTAASPKKSMQVTRRKFQRKESSLISATPRSGSRPRTVAPSLRKSLLAGKTTRPPGRLTVRG